MARRNENGNGKNKGKEVSTISQTGLVEHPDYLKGNERKGTEHLGKDDFKIPRIKLLQPLSPEIRSFQGKAIPGEFWHTGANKPLGAEFLFVPCIVGKRVVLWRPRDDGDGGILAFSKDAIHWTTGANMTFEVQPKNAPKVKWKTDKDVATSGLLEFGTSNPDNAQSAPAATLAYEYLCYLIDYPELSPCVFGVQRTGVGNAKQLNSHLLMTRRPTACVAIRAFSDETSKGRNTWHVPKFDPAGYVGADIYKTTSKIAEQYSEYEADIEQEDTQEAVDDNIKY